MIKTKKYYLNNRVIGTLGWVFKLQEKLDDGRINVISEIDKKEYEFTEEHLKQITEKEYKELLKNNRG